MVICWEPWDLVSEQYMSGCPVCLFIKLMLWRQSYLAGNNGFWGSAEYCWGCLLSYNIDDILGNFQHHFVSHGWDRCDHSRNPIFLQISSTKILWELMLLRFLLWGCQLSLQTLGTVLFQFWEDWRQVTSISVIMLCYVLNNIIILEDVFLWQLPFSFAKMGCTWLNIWPN